MTKDTNVNIILALLFVLGGFLYYTHGSYSQVTSAHISSLTNAAGPTHSVSGFAWSETIGWISLNSADCDTDNDGISDGASAGCPAAGTAIPNYGVDIDPSTGVFSGYAWSEHVGWIHLGPTSGYPTTPHSGVALNLTSNKVSGWAIAANGDDF